MEQEELQAIWEELCFHLSDNINPNINENIFEQKVLFALEKLGWSQYRREIKVRPPLQIGRQNTITPDIVIYTANDRAAIVLEIKRPAEDLNRTGSIGQLQSYMRQTKSDFGFLVGREIHVYYDGALNPNVDPLLLSKIRFRSDSDDGIKFVELFNRKNFIAERYVPILQEHIDRLKRQHRVNDVKNQLRSEETHEKMLKLLLEEFKDVETQVLTEAIKGLTITISPSNYNEGNENGQSSTVISKEIRESVTVCKNKESSKHFIVIDNLKNNELLLIKPDGVLISLSADLFEEPKDESIDYLLSHKLITETQLIKYNEYGSQQNNDDAAVEDDPDRTRIIRPRPRNINRLGRRESPPAGTWLRHVPELSRIPGLHTWAAICNHLNIHVGGNSARRALRDWVTVNRRNWPPIPEP